MEHWVAALVAALALAVATLVVLLGVIGVRQRRLELRGALPMSVRQVPGRRTRGWVSGVGRCEAERLAWYRTLSLSPRPRHAIPRVGLQVVSRHAPQGADAGALPADSVIVQCQRGGDRVELAMSERAAAGLLAWLEGVPPASRMTRGSS